MNRLRSKDWIWISAIFVFVLCVAEGFIYYYKTDNMFLRISLNIQNIINAFKLDPDIKQVQAVAFLEEYGNNGIKGSLLTCLTYMYCVAVLVAPFCTAAALLSLFEGPYAFIKGILSNGMRHRPKLLVLGKGKDYERFLDSLSKDCKLETFVAGQMSGDKRIYNLERGIKVRREYGEVKDWLRNKKNIQKYSGILLCDENELINLNRLKDIKEFLNEVYEKEGSNSKREEAKISPLDVYICSGNSGWAEEIGNITDKEHLINCYRVNIDELAANKMFMDYPIYNSRINQKRDVHFGIIGFGGFGQNALISGLNMAVLSENSTIRVDVFDYKVKENMDRFINKFSIKVTGILKHEKCTIYENECVDEYIIKFSDSQYFKMNGTIEIHFWETDVRKVQFKKVFETCNSEHPFSYIIASMGDKDLVQHLLIDMKGMLADSKEQNENNFSHETTIVAVVKDNIHGKYEGVNIINRNKDMYSYKALTNETIIKNAIRFHWTYSEIADVVYDKKRAVTEDEKAEIFMKRDKVRDEALMDKWKKSKIYDRESTLYQSLAQNTRIWIKKHYSTSNSKEIFSMIEHRRWVIYMITHGWRFEDVEKKDMVRKFHPCINTWDYLKANKPDMLEYDYIPFDVISSEDINLFCEKERL